MPPTRRSPSPVGPRGPRSMETSEYNPLGLEFRCHQRPTAESLAWIALGSRRKPAATLLSGTSLNMPETVSLTMEPHVDTLGTHGMLTCKTTDTIDLPYCGSVPQTITTGPSRTVYDTECNIIPSFVVKADHIKMYQQEVDLTLTCYTTAGYPVLGNSWVFFFRVTCYIVGFGFSNAQAECGIGLFPTAMYLRRRSNPLVCPYL